MKTYFVIFALMLCFHRVENRGLVQESPLRIWEAEEEEQVGEEWVSSKEMVHKEEVAVAGLVFPV